MVQLAVCIKIGKFYTVKITNLRRQGMNHITFHKTKIASLIMLAMGLPTAANAAEEGTDEEKDFGKIVVTATKRPQMAQDVPIALTAVSEDMLENSGVSSVADLRDMVAGLEIVSNGQGNNTISTRGVTSSSGGESVQSHTSVGYYLDETPISAFATTMPEIGLWDAERVEMLRGPQGTLFGEGSMAGTIRVISNKPDAGEFEGEVYASGSSTHLGSNNSTFRGKINVPLIDDELALRVVASNSDIGGWIDIPELNAKDTNSHKQTDIKVALRWTPSDEWIVDFSHTYQKLEVEGASQETSRGRFVPDEGLIIPLDAIYYDYYGDALGTWGDMVGPAGAIGHDNTKYSLTTLTVEYDLGWASLVSATAMFDLENDMDGDISEIGALFFEAPGLSYVIKEPHQIDINMKTQELRLVSDNEGNFNWTVGGFYKTSDRVLISGYDITIPEWGPPGEPFADLAFANQLYVADSYAFFGELSWMFGDSVELKIGGRHYSEDRSLVTTELNDSAVFGTAAGDVISESGDDSEFSPMAHLSWNVSDDVMLFVRYAEGFKAGGVNTNASRAAIDNPGLVSNIYKSEKLETIEIGMKSNISQDLQFNAYLYSSDWQDLQLGFITPDGLWSYTSNAGSASATGVEVELLSRPMDGLTLSLNAASVDAAIDEDVLDPTGYPVAIKDSKIPIVPDLTYSASANYSFPLTDTLSGLAFVSYSHRDESYSDPSNTPEKLNGDFNNVKLRIGVEGDTWGVYAYGDNLLDEDSTVYVNDIFGLLMYKNYTRPRTVGVEFTVSFY